MFLNIVSKKYKGYNMAIKIYQGHMRFKLQKVTIRIIEENEKTEWNNLMATYHYLKNGTMVGPQIRYVAEINGEAVALLGFSNASYHLESRDNYIDRNDIQRMMRLDFVVQNSRFLIFPHINKKNLASKVLSLCTKRLSSDWEEIFAHPVLIVETFTELIGSRRGTGYKASGRTRVGETKGFRRDRNGFYQETCICKGVWCKELIPNAREILSGIQMPDKYKRHLS